MVQRAHVIRLYPSGHQESLMRRACGVSRKAFNVMLDMWGEQYKAGEKPNWMKIQAAFVARIDTEFPYMRELDSAVYYQPARHLNTAFIQFFKKNSKYPKFKKRGQHDSFKCMRAVHEGRRVKIPKIGWMRTSELPRFAGRIISATISRVADTWEISLLWETDEAIVRQCKAPRPAVGVDLGIKTAMTLSTGETFEAPKPLKGAFKRLKRAQRRLARTQKGSKRSQAQRTRVARIHRRIRNIRKDFSHKATSKIADENQVIVLEDLNVRGLLKNHSLARAICDVGFFELRRQLEYKAADRGGTVLYADRFFPSSRMCRKCEHIHEGLTLADRTFCCPVCGHTEDRDLHAAKNLEAITTTQAHWGSNGRGEAKAIGRRKTKRASSAKRQLAHLLDSSGGPQD
ncbi:MAG TPA: RNA-guided endonuclease TnpB family protein [Bryobacteraceae bacterium]|nr:RNA-guided endonuclease TnpB family protein [Bryobacteraceae bacterium]